MTTHRDELSPKPAHADPASVLRKRVLQSARVASLLLTLLPGIAVPDTAILRVLTAGSAADTGVVDMLARLYEAKHAGVTVNTRAVGALYSLDLARAGEADLVITHHPESEQIFVAEGYGRLRTLIMYDQFAFFGPPADPLGLAKETEPTAVLRRMAQEQVLFMVPGRRSGTRLKLEELWAAAGIDPNWVGYETTNASVHQTLLSAALFDGYTFANVGAYLAMRERLSGRLAPLFRDHRALHNHYSAIVVSRERVPLANQARAEDFLAFLISEEAQRAIARFGEENYRATLFVPAAHLDAQLQARRAAEALKVKNQHLQQVSILASFLGLIGLVALILFGRAQKLERASRTSEERFALAVAGANDGIWDWDRQQHTVYFSPRAYEILGYDPQPGHVKDGIVLSGRQIHPADRLRVRQQLEEYLQRGGSGLFVSEHRLRTADKGYRWVLVRGKAIRDASGRPRRMCGSVTDVTEHKEQQAALEHQALHDALTGLPNRTLLLDRLQQAIHLAARERRTAALIVMDLDRFKEINDALGHQVGDLVLREVGGRLTQALRKSDTVVRLGGDEFAVLLPSADETYALHVARKIRLLLDKPFTLDRHSLRVGGSLGIALSPTHGEDADTLLKRADVAMYIAKHANAGCALYDETQDQHSIRRLELANDLHEALGGNTLQLYYQPQIDLQSGTVVGAEALLRWHHPQRGMVPPDEMIPIAEHSGLIRPLTLWVLDTAMAQCAQWHAQGTAIRIGVNLSVWNMQDPELVQQVAARLASWGVPPDRLELEITESTTMADPKRFHQVLGELDKLGVRLVIDDFGTGFSSLAYLNKLPFDTIKIDKSFVIGMDRDADSDAIVRSVIDLGHNLGLNLVAEGVENDAILDRLRTLGCDTAQGYHFARPMPVEKFLQWLAESRWAWADPRRPRYAH